MWIITLNTYTLANYLAPYVAVISPVYRYYSQMSGNIKSTLVGFKPLIGREFDDPLIQQNLSNMFNDIIRQEDGSIGFKVRIISYR